LANNHIQEWHTTDETNTQPVRLARCFVGIQAQSNRAFSIEGLRGMDFIEPVDLNDQAVANDMYRLLAEIARRADSADTLSYYVNALHDLCGKPSDGETPEDELLARWIASDKNGATGRQIIYRAVLAVLRDLKNKVCGTVVQASGLSCDDLLPLRPNRTRLPKFLSILSKWPSEARNSVASVFKHRD
jgi:hypothetical protein